MKPRTKMNRILPESSFKNKLRKIYIKIFNKDFYKKLKRLNIKKVSKKKIRFELLGEKYIYKFNRITNDYIDFLRYLISDELTAYLKYYFPRKGDIVIDAGGYIGSITYFISKQVGKEGQVYCFEPNQKNYLKIKEMIRLNNLENVTLIKKGLSDEVKKVKFYGGGTSGSYKNIYKKKKSQIIKLTTIDKFMDKTGLKKVDYIKSDIESAEIELIKGASKTLKKGKIKHGAIASYHRIGFRERTFDKCENLLNKMNLNNQTIFEDNDSAKFVTYFDVGEKK